MGVQQAKVTVFSKSSQSFLPVLLIIRQHHFYLLHALFFLILFVDRALFGYAC